MVNTLAYLYGEDAVQVQKFRINKNIEAFRRLYGDRGEIRIFSAPGRTEIGGNHTDHNKGRVLAAAVDLDIAAVVRPESGNVIRIKSAGFDEDVVDISDLSVKQ
ncbi:MAG: galactokinase family protein, partial [Oscillospiraceae bacterium]|nr:galactokinase family protein [Oscillospiraceae bacterium]